MNEIKAYVDNIPDKWQEAYTKLAKVIDDNIPVGYELVMQYGFPSYVVPLSRFPEGYLNRKDEPLPYVSLGAQKNHLALYNMAIMADKELLEWFQEEYRKLVPTKLNMGKSCIRMTNVKHIPYELIGELVNRVSVEDWVAFYEKRQDAVKESKKIEN